MHYEQTKLLFKWNDVNGMQTGELDALAWLVSRLTTTRSRTSEM